MNTPPPPPQRYTIFKPLYKKPSKILPILRTIYPPEALPKPASTPPPSPPPTPRLSRATLADVPRPATPAISSPEITDGPWIPTDAISDTCSCWVFCQGEWTVVWCCIGMCPRIEYFVCEICWEELQEQLLDDSWSELGVVNARAEEYDGDEEYHGDEEYDDIEEIHTRMIRMGRLSVFALRSFLLT
ncbi:hypothetical protein NX059_002057 [Plenodomus lindquistii]|nr:hypothetical protein NX059_002057 [Plenodomus lindquistii]